MPITAGVSRPMMAPKLALISRNARLERTWRCAMGRASVPRIMVLQAACAKATTVGRSPALSTRTA